MASGKIAFNGRSRTTRTRSGCLCCRQRKLKCDERKPKCQRCFDGNRDCSYGLKLTWPDEAASRGIVIGRAGTRTKGSSPPKSVLLPTRTNDRPLSSERQLVRSIPHQSWVAFLNTTTEDILAHNSQDVNSKHLLKRREDESGDRWDRKLKTPSAIDVRPFSFASIGHPSAGMRSELKLSESDSLLFDFYVNRMCSTCTLLDGQDNGYRNVIIPISVSSPLLLKSVLAVAANHLRFQDPSYRIAALEYRGITLKNLQLSLQCETGTVSQPELLSTILMLCFFDISDGCKSDWMDHLDGASKVLTQLSASSQERRANRAILSFIGEYFASHNIMAYTALAHPTRERERTLLEGGLNWLSLINRPDQEIDCVVGCSKELMSIILEVSQKIRHQHMASTAQERHDIFLWKMRTENRILELNQEIATSSDSVTRPLNNPTQSLSTLRYTAEAFRHATLILLQYLAPTSSSPVATQTAIQTSVRTILDLVSRCPISPIGARSSSLWPNFVAACHVTADEDRVLVLSRFHEMESRKRFGNIRPVREVVECVWKQADLRADGAGTPGVGGDETTGLPGELRGNEEVKRCFVWEEAMALMGINLSLT